MFSVVCLRERVDHRGVGIRHEEHVGFLDLLEAADRRAVEAEPFLEDVLGELVRGNREVLHEAGKVAEAHVDDLDALVLELLDDVTRSCHLRYLPFVPSIEGGGRTACTLVAHPPTPVNCVASSSAEQTVSMIEPGDDVRVHVGVRATVLDVALLVLLDLPRDADRGAAVGHAVAELVSTARSRAAR